MSIKIGVDLFAGAGGFTVAAESEGVEVVFAANHWQLAVDVHSRNHPSVRHVRQNLCQYDFTLLEPFDLLLAGVACQGHSRGGQVGRAKSEDVRAAHEVLRSTAKAVVDCAKVCRPLALIVENVPEFLKWAGLQAWLDELRALGYAMSWQVLTASRWGVPQRRQRVFFVGVQGSSPVAVQDPDVPELGIETIFDSSAPGWVPIADMRRTVSKRGAPTARERVEYANDKLSGALGWGVHVSHRGAWGRLASEPVTTLTTKAGQLWWVRDGMYRLWTTGERLGAMGMPRDYDLCGANKADTAKLLGNAVPPGMAAGVIRAALA